MRYDLHNDLDDRRGMSVQESLFADQARVLELIALGKPLKHILDAINRLVEHHSPAVLCSILLLDESGTRLQVAAADSFPESYNRAVDGLVIGPDVGSCGSAAYLRKPVFVQDIAVDPKWTKFKDLALSHGLRACWSSPIPLPDGRIAGTFAIYARHPRSPDVLHLELLETATHLAAIALQRHEAAEMLRQNDRDHLLQREQAARAAAENASRAKDQLLAVVSHELRTPLTPILAAVGLLGRNPALPPEARHLLTTIKRNAELEARLIDDLLDLTRITNGNVRLNIERVDAHALVNNALDIYRNEIRSKGLELSVELRADHRTLEADPARIQQVFWNLVSNAVKFTPADGRITVRSSNPSADRLRVEVADSGIGIDEQVMKRLFSAFEQGESSLTRRQGGLGLGLSISRALVELHGGTIAAQSAGESRGTTFTVEFPAARPVEGGKGREKDGGERRLQILLVEDNQDTAGMMTRLLRDFGHEVVTADCVHEAMKMAEERHFDLLISDIGLPDGSGWELMRRLRQRRHKVPAIALSGFGSEEDARNSREAGFLEHMVKPISVHKLEQVLCEVHNSVRH